MTSSQAYEIGDCLFCDVDGPLIKFKNSYQYIIIFIDKFSKFITLKPLRIISAKVMSAALLELFCQSLFYNRVYSDNHFVFSDNTEALKSKAL